MDESKIRDQRMSAQLVGGTAELHGKGMWVQGGVKDWSPSVTNATRRHCLSDYQSQELHAINIYWSTTVH